MDKKRRLVHCRRESCLHECPSFCPFKDEPDLTNHFHGDRDPPTVVKRYYLLCQACERKQPAAGKVTSLLTKMQDFFRKTPRQSAVDAEYEIRLAEELKKEGYSDEMPGPRMLAVPRVVRE